MPPGYHMQGKTKQRRRLQSTQNTLRSVTHSLFIDIVFNAEEKKQDT
jgi:hypothetical protein